MMVTEEKSDGPEVPSVDPAVGSFYRNGPCSLCKDKGWIMMARNPLNPAHGNVRVRCPKCEGKEGVK